MPGWYASDETLLPEDTHMRRRMHIYQFTRISSRDVGPRMSLQRSLKKKILRRRVNTNLRRAGGNVRRTPWQRWYSASRGARGWNERILYRSGRFQVNCNAIPALGPGNRFVTVSCRYGYFAHVCYSPTCSFKCWSSRKSVALLHSTSDLRIGTP